MAIGFWRLQKRDCANHRRVVDHPDRKPATRGILTDLSQLTLTPQGGLGYSDHTRCFGESP